MERKLTISENAYEWRIHLNSYRNWWGFDRNEYYNLKHTLEISDTFHTFIIVPFLPFYITHLWTTSWNFYALFWYLFDYVLYGIWAGPFWMTYDGSYGNLLLLIPRGPKKLRTPGLGLWDMLLTIFPLSMKQPFTWLRMDWLMSTTSHQVSHHTTPHCQYLYAWNINVFFIFSEWML